MGEANVHRTFIVPILSSNANRPTSKFSGEVIVKQSDGKALSLKQAKNGCWKETQEELIQFRVVLDNIHASVRNLASSLVAAQGRKTAQERVLADSPAVMIYVEPRRIDLVNTLSDVVMQVCGFKSMHSAINGNEPGFIILGSARDGDSLIVRRGVHILSSPLVFTKSVTLRRERTYAGGGGGGYSGGGGGGYGGGGGGGGGCYVSPKAQNVSLYTGSKIKKGVVQIVGNVAHGCVTIKEPIFSEAWEFLYSGKYEEWIVPRKSMFVIEAKGAAAASAGSQTGGTGAVVEGYFSLEKDDKIIMLVGAMSETYKDDWGACSGGGGGTFVFLNGISLLDIMLIAGGGGGAAFSIYSSISGGQHANTEQSGTDGTGMFCGTGGVDGGAGSTRLLSTCYVGESKTSTFSEQRKIKQLIQRGENCFAGAGSGMLEQARGAAKGVFISSKMSKNVDPGDPGVASGGVGGGGCAELHPEEVVIRSEDTIATVVCKDGAPTISGLILEQKGRETGSKASPQCVLVEGGTLKMRRTYVTCEDGIGLSVIKSFVAIANSDFIGSAFLDDGCKISACGNHGIVVSSGILECKDTTIINSAKDGLHIYGKDSIVTIEVCILMSNNQHNVFVTEEATFKANNCTIEKSIGSCCAVIGKGSSITMTSCHIRHSDMSGVSFSEGARGELRTCQIYGHHDVGVLAQGNTSLQKSRFAHPEDETSAQILHCNIKENGYGVWAQDGANISIIGGTISGSVHKDINQHIATGITTAGALLNVGGIEVRVRTIFIGWKSIAASSAALYKLSSGISLAEFTDRIAKVVDLLGADDSSSIPHDQVVKGLEQVGILFADLELEQFLAFFDDEGSGTLNIREVHDFFQTQTNKQKAKERLLKQQPSKRHLDIDDHETSSDGVVIVRKGYDLFEQVFSQGGKVNLRYDIEEHIVFTPEKPFQTEQIALDELEKLAFRDRGKMSAFTSALCVIQEDDILLLRKGRHLASETLMWTTGRLLILPVFRPASKAECTIVARPSFPAISLEGGSLNLRGLRFEQERHFPIDADISQERKSLLEEIEKPESTIMKTNLNTLSAVIYIKKGTVHADTCDFRFHDCSAFVENSGKLLVKECMISGQIDSGIGIIACYGGSSEIASSTFSGAAHAILAINGGVINLENSAFMQNRRSAIIAKCEGVVTINNCITVEAEGSGFLCISGGMIKAIGCQIIRSRRCGIFCNGPGSRIHIENCRIYESTLHGVVGRNQGNFLLKVCEVFLNRGSGIWCEDDGTKLRGYGIKVISNYEDGACCGFGAKITLESFEEGGATITSQLRQNRGCGIRMTRNGIFQGFELLVQGNGENGIFASSSASIELRLSKITSNQLTGIKAQDSGTKLSIFHSSCTGHQTATDVAKECEFIVKRSSLESVSQEASVGQPRKDLTNGKLQHYRNEDVMPALKQEELIRDFGKLRKGRVKPESSFPALPSDSESRATAASTRESLRLPSINK